MGKYRTWKDGESEDIKTKDSFIRFACCDCGLVHNFKIDVIGKDEIKFTIHRDNRATGQMRKHAEKNALAKIIQNGHCKLHHPAWYRLINKVIAKEKSKK